MCVWICRDTLPGIKYLKLQGEKRKSMTRIVHKKNKNYKRSKTVTKHQHREVSKWWASVLLVSTSPWHSRKPDFSEPEHKVQETKLSTRKAGSWIRDPPCLPCHIKPKPLRTTLLTCPLEKKNLPGRFQCSETLACEEIFEVASVLHLPLWVAFI